MINTPQTHQYKIDDVDNATQNDMDKYKLERRKEMCLYSDSNAEYLEQLGKYKFRINVLLSLGNIYSTMNMQQECLDVRTRHVNIVKKYLAEGKIDDENDLAKAYMNRGVTYYTIGQHNEALADYGKCIEIMERLHADS